jgi:hypothetical protein
MSAPQLQLNTLDGCGLAIAGYPRFRYDASGGGGLGSLGPLDSDGCQQVRFEAAALEIPILDWRTTRVLGLPLPPGLSIAIVPELLEGSLSPANGTVQLRFRARFRFRIGRIYRAPDLIVETELGTGPVQSRRHRVEGRPFAGQGDALLVGVARVPPSGDPWVDRPLGLPDEALALLRCRFRNVASTTPSPS